jgi:8-oxo-dGTP pyrophosphatase MutT (NUDIX family)
VRENAIREVSEETGLSVTTDELSPCGYERWRHVSGPWPNRPGQDVLQTFRATVASVRPILTPSLDDTDDRRWVTLRDYETLCSGEFWWPLADRVLRG